MTPRLLIVALMVGLVTLGACSSDHVDRDEAIGRVIDETGGRIGRDQAACYVDRVLEELGAAPLRPGAETTPEQDAELSAVRVDCIGVSNVGAGPASTAPLDAPDRAMPGPRTRGESPDLDALWDECAAGFGQACDDLFARAVIGSEYETFAASCGGRTRELHCAAVYPSPGVILPSAAQPTTTVPPPSP